MAFDEGLAERLRERLADQPDIEEKRMFGGLSFLLNGNMCCGVIGDELIVRIAPDDYAVLMEQPHVREFDFSGRPMKGWIVVGSEGVEGDDDLERWVDRGVQFASTLPPK